MLLGSGSNFQRPRQSVAAALFDTLDRPTGSRNPRQLEHCSHAGSQLDCLHSPCMGCSRLWRDEWSTNSFRRYHERSSTLYWRRRHVLLDREDRNTRYISRYT